MNNFSLNIPIYYTDEAGTKTLDVEEMQRCFDQEVEKLQMKFRKG